MLFHSCKYVKNLRLTAAKLTSVMPQQRIAYSGAVAASGSWVKVRIAMGLEEKTAGNRTRVLTLIVTVLFVVFLTQVTAHIHERGQNETTCWVCQAAHLSSILPSATLPLCVAPHAVEYVGPSVVAYHDEFFFNDSPSRAPPSRLCNP